MQLPDAYLTKVDVASMAASLEVRAPLLDQKVIEEAWILPDRMKLHWGQRKWLLKRIASRWLPREVIYRPKMGFGLPLVHWWRGELGAWLELLMKDSFAEAEGWIQAEPVRRMLSLHRKGENHHTRLWLVLWLELWFRLVACRTASQDPEDVGESTLGVRGHGVLWPTVRRQGALVHTDTKPIARWHLIEGAATYEGDRGPCPHYV